MNWFTCIFIICVLFPSIHMMSETQMKSTAKLMRNVCQPKSKVTNEQIDNMHKGIFEDDTRPKCYMLCALQMMKAIKKDVTFDYDFSMKQVATLPPRYQEPSRITIEQCKDSLTDTDNCERGYQLAKCMYFRAPEFYFLP